MQSTLEQEIKSNLHEGKLRCATAHSIAARAGASPLKVGEAADRLDVRISHCQLGLFGYGDKSQGKHKIVRAAETPDADVVAAVRAVAAEGRVSCAALFEISARLGRPKLDVSGQVEALGLKIAPCQLGCF